MNCQRKVVESCYAGYQMGDTVVCGGGWQQYRLAGRACKCACVVDELAFDACIDHQAHRDINSLAAAIDAAAPKGIDELV